MGVARNAGYNFAGAVVPLAISLITVPLYIEVVGLERYGILALCWVVLGFLGFLNLGVGPAVAQRLAGLASASDRERSEVFWTGLWLTLLLGAVGALVVYGLAGAYFEGLLVASRQLAAEIPGSLPWLALMVPVAMLASLMGGVLMGRERFLDINIINIAGSILMALLPLAWAVFAGPQLEGLLAAALAGRVAALTMMVIASVRAVPVRDIQSPAPVLMRKLLAYGGWVTVSSLIAPVLATVDQVAIGAIVSAAAVSVYAIPYNVVSRLSILPSSLAIALFPRFAATERREALNLQADSVATLVALMTPLAIALLAILGPFLRIWIGRDLADQTTTIAYILVVGFWFNSSAHVAYVFLQATGRPDLLAKLHIAFLLPVFTMLYFSLSWFGVIGAAIAWSVRSVFDPVLFAFSGGLRHVLAIIAPAAVLVLAAMTIAIIFPWTGWPHWLAMLTFFALAVLMSMRILPEAAWAQIGWVWANMPWRREGPMGVPANSPREGP